MKLKDMFSGMGKLAGHATNGVKKGVQAAKEAPKHAKKVGNVLGEVTREVKAGYHEVTSQSN